MKLNKSQRRRLEKVKQDLSKIIKSDAVDRWLNRPNKKLGGKTPMDKIIEGDIVVLEGIIYRLRSGEPG